MDKNTQSDDNYEDSQDNGFICELTQSFLNQKLKEIEKENKSKKKIKMVYIFDVKDASVIKKIRGKQQKQEAIRLSKDKSDQVNGLLIQGIEKSSRKGQNIEFLRFTLLQNRLRQILTDSFTKVELYAGKYSFRAYSLTILTLLIRLEETSRLRRLEYTFGLLTKLNN